MANSLKKVWVLGAGFSAGVGGPLFKRLLSKGSKDDLAIRFSAPEFHRLRGVCPDLVFAIYHYGRGWEEGAVPPYGPGSGGVVMWADAEEFLDYVDTAAVGDASTNRHAQRLRKSAELLLEGRTPAPSPAEMRDSARRLMAAECCGFLEGVDPNREQWTPFRRWEQGLGELDTVITFNYDRVVEMLGEHEEAASQVAVIRPGQPDDLRIARAKKCCPMFKLHGSTDWKLVDRKARRVEITDDPCFALKCPDNELAIATPGPSKHDTIASFVELWQHACDALREADQVIFIGYRFPPTDADARESLLSALRENKSASGNRDAHVVLGDSPFDSKRLESLLRFTHGYGGRGTLSVNVHPLYGQDFLSVFDGTYP